MVFILDLDYKAIYIFFFLISFVFTMLSVMEMKFPVIKNLQGKRRKEYMKGGHFVWYVEIHVYTLYMDIGVCTSFKL